MNGKDEKDFLEDLSNLSDELKHPTNKNSEIDEIDIDNLLDDSPLDLTTIEPEPEQLPVKQNTGNKELIPTTETVIPEKNDSDDIQNYILKQCQDIISQ